MDFNIPACSTNPYTLHHPEDIETPALLVFKDRVLHNMTTMKEQLKAVDKELNINTLCPHVKTHKSAWTLKQQMDAGIEYFKSSLNELDMLVKNGAKKIFVAYPLLPHSIKKITTYLETYPETEIHIQVGHEKHIDYLEQIAPDRNWQIYIDLDVGMHRTGAGSQQALELWKRVKTNGWSFLGIHGYDGHNHTGDETEKQKIAQEAMAALFHAVQLFESQGAHVENVVVGGSPGFLADLKILLNKSPKFNFFLSPGTWIYHDSDSMETMDIPFNVAAMILCQVIDRPNAHTLTLNLGYKRWSIDQGIPEHHSLAGGLIKSWSEEHTMMVFNEETKTEIGEYILIAPRHVCSTVNLWETFTLVDEQGHIENKRINIDARNR